MSYVDADSYLEHGLSYYASGKTYSLTPGHTDAGGTKYRTFDPGAAILRCFQCHSTGPLTLSEGNRIQPFDLGVRCEACHGPGAAHAKAPATGNILNPKRYSSAELNQACGSCHRMPAAAGESTDWTNPWNVRHQPLYLAESSCFLKSGGKLSCLTCHDAHSGKAIDACANCHSGVKHRTATASRSCVSCHMPTVKPNRYLAFTNHWIGTYTPGVTTRPRRSR